MAESIYTDNLIEGLIDFCHSIYVSIYNSAVGILAWYNGVVETIGYNPLELMLGSGVVLVLGYILTKWILDIWPG